MAHLTTALTNATRKNNRQITASVINADMVYENIMSIRKTNG